MINNKESDLYEAFIEALISKVKSGEADIKELNLVKEFLNDRNIGANPKTHKPTKDLAASLPFEDEHDGVIPIRKSK